MVYSVATKTRDGKIAFHEVTGKRDANRLVKNAPAEVLRVGKEAANDR
jgi:hypothetical protein